MEASKQRRAFKQRGVFGPGKALRLHGVLGLMLVGTVSLGFAGACGDSSDERKAAAKLGEGCVLNSDCNDPFSCTFERCHEQCVDSRDCPGDERCVLTDEDFHVCQLDIETECEEAADCKGDQTCGVDAECRDECDGEGDCVDGQACSYGLCADEEELTDDGQLPIATGHEPDGSGGSAGMSSGGTDGGGTGGGTTSTGGGGTGGTSTTSTTGTPDAECGNGILDEDEECDDDGTQPGDGCNSTCEEETGWLCDGGAPTLCEDINECIEGTATCHADANCMNSDGDFACECKEGFVGDGYECEDACEADPSTCSLPVVQVVTGDYHTCALFDTGKVRCWGYGAYGATGYGNQDTIGDNELATKDVNVGGTVVQLSAGGYHTCALLDDGAVRCWGQNTYGELGYGNIDTIGDNEVPGFAGDVNVGGEVVQIASGPTHTCAILATGAVRCWGYNGYGQLGYGNTASIGDDEVPDDAGNVDLGAEAIQIAVGTYHTCAVLTDGAVRCWGYNGYGQLGYGNTDSIGDNEAPADADDVDVGGPVTQVSLGEYHTCALLETGTVRCWGYGVQGQLGYGDTNSVGDSETPDYVGDVSIGAPVTALACGQNHSCVVLDDGGVLCWGANSYGELGQGDLNPIGDNEVPASIDAIVLGDTAEGIAVQDGHACALTSSANVRCWGYGGWGSLGYGNATQIGDDENPSIAGPVELL